MSQVDLDALEKRMIVALFGDGRLIEDLRKSIAELRELRELVGCATEFRIGRCKIVKSYEAWDLWAGREMGYLYPTLDEALAAARKWEAENV